MERNLLREEKSAKNRHRSNPGPTLLAAGGMIKYDIRELLLPYKTDRVMVIYFVFANT